MTSESAALVWLDEVDSTSSHLIRLLKDGAPVGSAVAAGSQTGGRGQYGRTWHSPAGGVYLSVSVEQTEVAGLPFAAAIAAAETLKLECQVDAKLRWPNDLLVARVDGLRRKIGGVLVESISQPACCIIGCGLNINNESFPEGAGNAISAQLVSGRSFSIERCGETLLERLRDETGRLHTCGFESTLARWREFDVTAGSSIRLKTSDGDIMVEAAGVDDQGRLLVKKGADLVAVAGVGSVQWPGSN